MAKIHHLPPLGVIKGFRGVLDFYLWRGIPCVRKWPHIAPANRSPRAVASAKIFGAIILGYALLGGTLKTLFAEDAKDQTRTGRDLYISAVLGHLHEASMGDFLDLLTECTAYLQTLTSLVDALTSSGLDQLDVNVLATVLAADAATQTTLAELTARIGDEAAPGPGSVNDQLSNMSAKLLLLWKTVDGYIGGPQERQVVRVDEMPASTTVKGEDQLFSFLTDWHESAGTTNTSPGANSFHTTDVPAGEIRVVTAILAFNVTTDIDHITVSHFHDPSHYYLADHAPAAIRDALLWQGHLYQTEGHDLMCWFDGCAGGDTVFFETHGYRMTLET